MFTNIGTKLMWECIGGVMVIMIAWSSSEECGLGPQPGSNQMYTNIDTTHLTPASVG